MQSTDRLIANKDVAKMLSISVQTMEIRLAVGLIPSPERVGKRRMRAYRESLIPGFIQIVTGEG